jgi:hypothetical protein
MSGLLAHALSRLFGGAPDNCRTAKDIMSIEPHLPRDHAFGPEDVEILSSALEETLCSLRLIDRIDPAVSMVAERLIQLATDGERDSARLREEALKSLWR